MKSKNIKELVYYLVQKYYDPDVGEYTKDMLVEYDKEETTITEILNLSDLESLIKDRIKELKKEHEVYSKELKEHSILPLERRVARKLLNIADKILIVQRGEKELKRLLG